MLVQRCSFKAPQVCEKAKDLKNGVCFNCTQHPVLNMANLKYVKHEESPSNKISGPYTMLGLPLKKFWFKQDEDKPQYVSG